MSIAVSISPSHLPPIFYSTRAASILRSATSTASSPAETNHGGFRLHTTLDTTRLNRPSPLLLIARRQHHPQPTAIDAPINHTRTTHLLRRARADNSSCPAQPHPPPDHVRLGHPATTATATAAAATLQCPAHAHSMEWRASHGRSATPR